MGLELAGETREVWPDKQITIVDPAEELLPGFLPEVREDLWRQLAELGVEVRLTARTDRGEVPVTDRLNVEGYDHVDAIGDLAHLAEAKMAGYAGQHAAVVAQNRPLGHPMILLPLGTEKGVGQLPTPEGPVAASAETVSLYKGTDIFTGRFSEQFGIPKQDHHGTTRPAGRPRPRRPARPARYRSCHCV